MANFAVVTVESNSQCCIFSSDIDTVQRIYIYICSTQYVYILIYVIKYVHICIYINNINNIFHCMVVVFGALFCFIPTDRSGSTFHEDSRAYPYDIPMIAPCLLVKSHEIIMWIWGLGYLILYWGYPLRTASWIKVQYGIHRSLSQSLKKSWHQRRVRRRRQTRLRRFAARDLLGSEIHRFMVYGLRPWSALEAIHGILVNCIVACIYIYIFHT